MTIGIFNSSSSFDAVITEPFVAANTKEGGLKFCNFLVFVYLLFPYVCSSLSS